MSRDTRTEAASSRFGKGKKTAWKDSMAAADDDGDGGGDYDE